MKRKVLFFLFIGAIHISIAQQDTIISQIYTPDFKFNEGLYLNMMQVKFNNPVPKTRIISKDNYKSLDFFSKLVENEKITYFDTLGIQHEVESKTVWGFSRGGSLYINWNGEFNRIGLIGSICHYVANKTVYTQNYYDPYSSAYRINPTYGNQAVEMRQYLLDFESEKVYDYDIESLEVILMRDTELYDEFHALKRKKKEQSLFLYVRKFNERHPLKIYNSK